MVHSEGSDHVLTGIAKNDCHGVHMKDTHREENSHLLTDITKNDGNGVLTQQKHGQESDYVPTGIPGKDECGVRICQKREKENGCSLKCIARKDDHLYGNPIEESNKIRVLVIIAFVYEVVALTMFVMVVFLVVRLEQLKTDQQRTDSDLRAYEEKRKICVPCKDIKLGPELDKVNLKLLHVDEKEDKCCATDNEQFSNLVDLINEGRYREAVGKGAVHVPQVVYVNDASNATEYLQSSKPSAHLTASDESKQKEEDGPEVPQQIRIWNHNSDNAFVDGGLEYKEGRLIVHREGNYHIYSTVTFMERYTDKKLQPLSDHSLMHVIARYNIFYPNGGEERLFEASVSQCSAKHKQYGEYVNHLGGVVRLSKSDEIYVKVRDIRSMVQRPSVTYFGAYML